ncbi:restriction endonuclease subunit S [Acidihalobacter yilgarnensis]|uniref:restriction endonuclease subunit S n=1 Tax=Acidihalobacter yilgarnensis TaxID=2819280 RepID=UPI0009F3F54E|nr:restriction endonuclease subunit S [Acidihalobacter yilgarnensis]
MAGERNKMTIGEIAAKTRNALVGGPFGSNLVSADYTANGVPVIRGQNMGSRWVSGEFAYVSPEKAQSLQSNLARPGDIVFTQRGTLGQVALVPEGVFDSYVVSQSQMKLTVDQTKANSHFLYYLFSSPAQQEYIRQNAIQVGVPHTNLGILRDTPVSLPSIDEQRAIAHILGTLDDKIELNRCMNETLEAIARAIFKSWFVDFDPVRAKASGEAPESICRRLGLTPDLLSLFPNRFVDSELGEIPERWEVRAVGDVIERLSVGKKYEQKTVKTVGKVPVLDQGKSGIIGFHDDEPGVTASTDSPVAVFANHTCYMRLIYFPFSAIQNVLPFVGKGVDTIWAFQATFGKQAFIEYKGHWPDFVIHKVVVPDLDLATEYSKVVHSMLTGC